MSVTWTSGGEYINRIRQFNEWSITEVVCIAHLHKRRRPRKNEYSLADVWKYENLRFRPLYIGRKYLKVCFENTDAAFPLDLDAFEKV